MPSAVEKDWVFMNIGQILLAVFIFGMIIAIHEFGHFIVARRCGIRVNEFAIGMGPTIFKTQRGETKYALRLFPIGGFCAMEGEDTESEDSRAFRNASVPKRMAVTLAGAFMNILLGFLLIVITTSFYKSIPTTTVQRFRENAVSPTYGLREGDKILKINNLAIITDSDIAYALFSSGETEFDFVVHRNGAKVTLSNVSFGESKSDFIVKSLSVNPLTVMSYSARSTVTYARLIWITLIDFARGRYGVEELSGPVGIVDAIGEASSTSTINLLSLVVFLTINVGIFNLLPLPALDGGRFVFLVVEAIRGKPLKPEVEGLVHFIGLAALFLLMVFVSFNDVKRLL